MPRWVLTDKGYRQQHEGIHVPLSIGGHVQDKKQSIEDPGAARPSNQPVAAESCAALDLLEKRLDSVRLRHQELEQKVACSTCTEQEALVVLSRCCQDVDFLIEALEKHGDMQLKPLRHAMITEPDPSFRTFVEEHCQSWSFILSEAKELLLAIQTQLAPIELAVLEAKCTTLENQVAGHTGPSRTSPAIWNGSTGTGGPRHRASELKPFSELWQGVARLVTHTAGLGGRDAVDWRRKACGLQARAQLLYQQAASGMNGAKPMGGRGRSLSSGYHARGNRYTRGPSQSSQGMCVSRTFNTPASKDLGSKGSNAQNLTDAVTRAAKNST